MANVLVVGAGISGCVSARLLAEKGYEVLLIDRRNHIGGSAYDAKSAAGLTIHMHGAHIFHAKENRVWEFLGRFTDWKPYQHRVQTYVQGRYLPFPINLDTINQLYGFSFDVNGMGRFMEGFRPEVNRPKNFQEAVVARIGPELYELFYKNYTEKLWGQPGEELPVSLAGRQSARENRDPRYFTDCYQGVPDQGYTALFTSMLNHPNIEIRLNTPYAELPDYYKRLSTVYTGCIDEYFDYRFGRLPYRSMRFVFKTYECERFQPAPVVHYPNDYDFMRATEFKQITGESSPRTSVLYEYAGTDGEPYQPMPTREAKELYQKYADAAELLEGIHFTGPLGRYRHMDMNHAALEAMDMVEREFPSDAVVSIIVLD